MRVTRPMSSPARRILRLVSMPASVLVAGTLGFNLIEGRGYFESFYMTLITLTTIGYEETIELSRAGRYFNTALILAGVGVVFGTIGMLADELIAMEFLNHFEQRRTKRMIKKYSDHFIVCGLGRVGRGVIEELLRSGASVVAIDQSDQQAAWANERGVPVLTLDATVEESLEQAGARQAKGLVAAISSDAENVYITLTARVLNPQLRIAARAATEAAHKKLLQAGANNAFTPYRFTGYRLAQALLRPNVASFLEFSTTFEGAELEVEEYSIEEGSACAGSRLGETAGLEQLEQLEVIVLALSAPDGSIRFKPPPDTRLEAGDALILLGMRPSLDQMLAKLGP